MVIIREKRVSYHGTIILLIKKRLNLKNIVLTRYYQLIISQIIKIFFIQRHEIYNRNAKTIRCTN